MSIDLSILNTEQKEAVTQVEGPYLINAGPGSGKTRVLTYRIAHLIFHHRVPAYKILALTFTNKAAKEMGSRIKEIIGPEAQSIWLGTFHSIFSRILRIEHKSLNMPSSFSIYSRSDSLNLIKILIKELNLAESQYKPKIILNRISHAKNRLIDAHAYSQNPNFLAEDQAVAKPKMGALFLAYQNRCKSAHSLDFDDLLLKAYQILTREPQLLNKWQAHFNYILVDEFQDTNTLQYALLKLLAQPHQNLCVIGDDAQSIYAFRGATLDNILSFQKDYPAARITRLEQNYRSQPYIVAAANDVIGYNKRQLPKTIFTKKKEGKQLLIKGCVNELEEAEFVTQSILDEARSKGCSYDAFAILCRTNYQNRVFEENFRKRGIPYRLIGSLSFYERKEIKDLIAYLTLLINPNNEQAIRRVINFPKRGIGTTTVDRIIAWSVEEGSSLWEALKSRPRFLSQRAQTAIQNFVRLIEGHSQKNENAYVVAESLAKATGILQQLHNEKTPEGLSRYENIQEFLNAIKQFTVHHPDKSLADFLQAIALLSDKESETEEAKVTLATIHSVKGLEFSHVYLVGMEQEIFPSPNMATQEDLEEERRLYYVAITRAKEQLYLSYAQNRYRFGQQKKAQPSQFLEELDKSYVSYLPSNYSSRNSLLKKFRSNYTSKPSNKKKLHAIPTQKEGARLTQFNVNSQVKHPRFGLGVIQEIQESGPHTKVIIQFNRVGKKNLLLSLAKLTLV